MGKYQLAELWVARTKAKNVVVVVKKQRQKHQPAVHLDLQHLNVLRLNLHVPHLNQLGVVLRRALVPLQGLLREALLRLEVLLGLKLQLV